MDPAEDRAFLNVVARFSHLVETNVVIDGRVFVGAAAAEVANDFTNDAGVAIGDAAGALGAKFDAGRRFVHLFVEFREVSALRFEHEAPALIRGARLQAVSGTSTSGFDFWGGMREAKKVRGALDDEIAQVVGAATLQALDGLFDFDPIAGCAAERDVHGS